MAKIEGDNNSNLLVGSVNSDQIFGYGGNDRLFGDSGDDTLSGGSGSNLLNGGFGNDTADYSSSAHGLFISLATGETTNAFNNSFDTLLSIENVTGSNFNDTIYGDDGNNRIMAGGGNDTVLGGLGYDSLYGEAGNDLLIGGDNGDGFSGGTGNDRQFGGTGSDRFTGDAGADSFFGGADIDMADYSFSSVGVQVLLPTGRGFGGDAAGDTYDSIENVWGSGHDDVLQGDAGNNELVGFEGSDIISGFDGNDRISGTDGHDQLRGGNHNDLIRLVITGDGSLVDGGAGIDTLDLSAVSHSALPGTGVTIDLVTHVMVEPQSANSTVLGIENVTGSRHADVIQGDALANTLRGGGSVDNLNGRGGNDGLHGDAGKDLLTGGLGLDTFHYHAYGDSLASAANRDVISDFSRADDIISLKELDANSLTLNDNAFAFIGTSAFSGVAGQLRYAAANGVTIISADANGDRVADLQIELRGLFTLTAADFIL